MFWFLGILAIVIPLAAFALAWAEQKRFPLSAALNARFWGAAGALLALLSVLADAYITHAAGGGQSVPGIASNYQMIHAVGLIAVALLAGLQKDHTDGFATAAGWFFALGILGFCGALFLRSAGLLSLVGLAPLGGVALMLGWLTFAVSLYRRLR